MLELCVIEKIGMAQNTSGVLDASSAVTRWPTQLLDEIVEDKRLTSAFEDLSNKVGAFSQRDEPGCCQLDQDLASDFAQSCILTEL